MAARGKSSSKFRFIEGAPFQNRDCYNDIRVGSASAEASLIKSNSKYFAVPWATPGSLAVVSLDQKGALDPESLPLIVQDEQMAILEFAFNPFDDNMLVTSAEDGRAFLWKWPENCSSHITTPTAEIVGHEKRLLFCDFHPKVEGVVVTADFHKITKVWDVSQGSAVEKVTLPNDYKGLITSVTWSPDGALMATSSKDNFLRIFDPRSNQMVAKVANHQGAKSGRALWCGGAVNKILTTGFSKAPVNRELRLWDPRAMDKFIAENKIDQSSSISLPLFDEDTSVLYLNGKGEGLINFFDLGKSSFDFLGKYQSVEPASAVSAVPKTSLDVMKCEIFRLLKLTPKGRVVPIKLSLSRAESNFFQDDLFPPTWDRKPLTGASSWFDGDNGKHNVISLDPEH